MKKIYVIDTNVLIQSPNAIENFEDNEVVIPLVVVEELDCLKKADGDKGANARAAVRLLEKYRSEGDLLKGVNLKNDGILRIEKNYTVLRLKAQIIGVIAEDYTTEQIQADDADYTGRSEAYIPNELIKEFKKKGIDIKRVYQTDAEHAPLVIIKGMAGTAKTFYSLAVGLDKVYNNSSNEYRRIIVCRPNAQFDDEIGFLPGDEKEKIAPLMRPIIDNLEQILDSDEDKRYDNEEELSDKISEVFARGIIQTEALNFIRGRSLIYEGKSILLAGDVISR